MNDFKRAVLREPDNRFAWMNQSFILDSMDWEAERCRVLRSVVDRWKTGWGHHQLGDCYEDRDMIERALSSFHRAHSLLRRGSTDALERLKELALERGALDRAQYFTEKLLDVSPLDTDYLFDLANIQLRKDKLGEAEKLYTSIVEQIPGWVAPYRKLADISFELTIKCPQVAPEEYSGFRKAVQRASTHTPSSVGFEFETGK